MKTSKSKMIQTVIALLIMFVAGFIIPTWGPVTRMGVQYLCIMVGWIYLSIVTGGLLLSSVIALTACVIPGYYTAASIVTTTLGNSITLLMIFIFIMVYIFQKTKTGEFLVRWLLSRKVVNGRPYLFTAFFFLAIIVIGAVIGSFGIILLAIAILSAVSEVTGMSIKDDWFRFLLLSTVALSGTTEVLFPFKPYSVLYMSIFDAQLNTIGTACDGNTWLITAIIMAALSFVFLMGFVICLLCLIHVDGEPIAEIGDVFKNGTNWQIIFAVGSVIAIGGAMAADVCGVATWLLSIFQGIFGGMSIVTVVIIVCVLSCLITQFFSNSATAILFLTALAPLAVVLYQEGINVSVFPALIGTGTLTACLLPSGSGQSAIMLSTDIFADDGQQWALSKGIVVLVAVTLAIVASGVISILVL